jgi:hypothetical protein
VGQVKPLGCRPWFCAGKMVYFKLCADFTPKEAAMKV